MGDVQGAVWSTPCALLSTEVPGYLYGGADGSPACAQHFLSVGASLWQMGPGSWTKLISSTPPLKGTVERLLRSALYLHGPSRAEPSHDGEKKKNTHTHTSTQARTLLSRPARRACQRNAMLLSSFNTQTWQLAGGLILIAPNLQ